MSTFIGARHPEFWTAWSRGSAPSVDLLDTCRDFWEVVDVPPEDLRHDCGGPAVEAALRACCAMSVTSRRNT